MPLIEDRGKARGDVGAAGPDTDEDDLVEAAVGFGDLAGEAFKDKSDLRRVEDAFLLGFRVGSIKKLIKL